MNKVLKDLQNYQSQTDKESDEKKRCLELIKKPNVFDKNYDHGGHFTASAFITNRSIDKVLLVHHLKLNKWIQPGGHCDGSSDAYAAAIREAEEETGVKNLELLVDGIFDIDIHTIPAYAPKNEPEHTHYDIRYAFVASENEPLVLSDESHNVGWFSFDDVADIKTDLSVLRMIKKAKYLR